MNLYLRSFLFLVFFYGGSFCLFLLALPLLAAPRAGSLWLAETWSQYTTFLLKHIVGISWELRGQENLPKGPCLIAAKHQSAWDTLIYHQIVKDPALVMKSELMHIPLYSWYIRKLFMIVVDRNAGAKALMALVRGTKRALQAQRTVIIFPEGTRSIPGTQAPYQGGVAALYDLGYPVLPAATNSGVFWGRQSFLKNPGTIVLQVLPPLPSGLSREAFMNQLKEQIETFSEALYQETCQGKKTNEI